MRMSGRCASLLGAAAGAAQQIMSTLFWGSTTLSAEPFNTAGQTFLPDHYDPETPDVITPRFRLTLQRLLDSSLLWGLAITLGTYPLKSEKALSMFTTSKDVMRLVAIGPILAVGALIAPMLTAEGTLLCGHQDFTARLRAIDATPARWRGDAGSSPLDRASTATSSQK